MNFLIGFLLCCSSVLMMSQNVEAANNVTIIYTESSGAYVDWYPVPASGIFKFKIRARAFTINLASYPVNEYPKIEIGVCHPQTSKFGTIWRDNQEVTSMDINKKYYANESKFVSYWVKWFNHYIEIGIEGENNGFLTFDDPSVYPINYIGVHSIASSNPAIWIIDNN